MSEFAGLWDYELQSVVERMQQGGAVRLVNKAGSEVIVRVEKLDPARFEPVGFFY